MSARALLRDEDHLALLGGAIHKSKRKVEELLARWFPKADSLSSVRKVSVAGVAPVATAPVLEPNVGMAPSASAPDGQGEGAFVAVPVAVPQALQPVSRPGRPSIAPLSADRYQVKFTATAATIAKLERAQELLSHAVPNHDVGEIFDRALDVLLEHAARQKHAATERPRRGRPLARGSRTIPADVEREVWSRDGGRCAFVAGGGRRCEEGRFVEFHHVKPWIAEGPPTADNIALRCRAHNAYEASLYFGPIRVAMEARTRSGTS